MISPLDLARDLFNWLFRGVHIPLGPALCFVFAAILIWLATGRYDRA